MKKILIIGAGIGQVYIAKKIKGRGHFLITVTMPGDYPVIAIADRVYYENVFNKDAVLQIARQEKIDGVISDQNDMMMPIVAYVAEHMGLPGNYTKTINAFCDKNIYRSNCDKIGIPVPRHCSVSEPNCPSALSSVPFPWVVKPADSQSSVGVCKVHTKDEYYKAIEYALNVSKTHTAIVEEFFEGRELVVEGFVYKGKYYCIGFADRKYFNLPGLFIPSQTLFPADISQSIKDKILAYETKMMEYTQPMYAIVHSEYLYNETTHEIRVVESALRGGGVYISSHLAPLYCGIDINDLLLDCVEGKDVDIETLLLKVNYRASGYVCFYLPHGTIRSVSGVKEIREMDFVKMVEVNDISVGMDTPQLTHKGQRFGPILIDADNREQLEMRISSLQKIMHIEVEGCDGIIRDIVWN